MGGKAPTLSVSRDSAVDERGAGELSHFAGGRWDVDFAAAVDVDDASVADPHLGGDFHGSDVPGALPKNVYVLRGRLEDCCG